jgi:hypothetical protein
MVVKVQQGRTRAGESEVRSLSTVGDSSPAQLGAVRVSGMFWECMLVA